MAVALNPTKTLYSKKPEKKTEGTDNTLSNNNFVTDYADSPSRQLRRSARVASLSPSSFTPLISQQSNASSSGTASSYMPTSPSSKYSMMRGGYNGVSIDEIVINEIKPENNTNKTSKSLYPTLEPLRSNPDRKHPTLNFQPTNLSTPSTTFLAQESGITPAIKQINLKQEQQTPGILDKLVSKGDMEEIAKATPLGTFYNRKATEATVNIPVGAGVEKSKIQIISEKSKGTGGNYNNNNNSTSNSNNSHSTYSTHSTNSTLTSSNSNNNNNNNSYNNNSHSTSMARTPQKQTSESMSVNRDSDETVKVVRTLRNRSIVASPVQVSSSLRRNSLAPPQQQQQQSKPKIDVTVLFKKHQKNLLAYSLVGLFLFATFYHIYDGLTNISSVSDSDNNTVNFSVPEVIVQPPLTSQNDEILKIINEKFTEIQELENEKILNLFEKAQETFNEKLEKLQAPVTANIEESTSAELQRKALESVTKSVKSLEKKFQALEAKIEQVEKVKTERVNIVESVKQQEEAVVKQEANNIAQSTPTYASLKVAKHLSTSPIGSGLFKSSQFPPENALSSQPLPFKFAGNRGKLAVLVQPAQALPSQVILEHPLLPDRSCAPRDIEIWALPNALNERDHPVLVAKGTFDLSKESQAFKLNRQRLASFGKENSMVLQLRIRNNHGNDKVTCLYNLKVQL